MFLSNLGKSFLLAVLFVSIIQGCGSARPSQNVPAALPPETKSGYPFSTIEPDIYQGDMVMNGRDADRTFVARKGERRRTDIYQNGTISSTEMVTDKVYNIDHKRKVYAEEPFQQGRVDSFAGLPFDPFKGKEFYEFDETGREGGIVKYKVRSNKYMPDDILIDVDSASGIIVRQEFRTANTPDAGPQPGFVYEMRNLKLEVDESTFALPSNYRKMSMEEFKALQTKK